MPLVKKDATRPIPETATVPTPAAPMAGTTTADSGTTAAVERLNKAAKKTEAMSTGYKPRDYDGEARGKTRCAAYNAALQSPAVAGLPFKDTAELKTLIREMADDCVAYTFGETK